MSAVVVGFGEQRFAVPFAELAAVDQLDGLVGQVEQTDGVREVGAAATQPPRQRSGGDVEVAEQRRDRPGLLDRREILAGDVLDQRELERSRPVHIAVDQRRDRRFAGELRGTPAPLACHEL